MRAYIGIPLAGLFVFLAAFNVWIMLTGRGATPRSRKLWTQAHRIAGYTFIALYVIFCYFMLLRIRGTDELSPRIIFHMGLALILGPLLMIKVIVVRYQKAAWNVAMTLGITIFTVAFTLVAVNVAVHYLRDLAPHKLPFATSLRVIAAVIIAAGIALFARAGQSRPKAVSAPPINKPDAPTASSKADVLNLTLARIEQQTHDAKTLRFVLPRGQQIAARPGQFLTFDWVIDGKPVKRSYSICSSPTRASFIEITPKKVENGYVSKFLNERATLGMTVEARGPYGKFHFDEDKHQRIVLIAGGSGITPMIAMLRYIEDLCLKVDATLIYCVRDKKDIFFQSEIFAAQQQLNTFRSVVVLSQPASEWMGWKGRLRREILEREVQNPSSTTFFLCGPHTFMELSRNLLKEIGVDPSKILQESFGGAVAGEKHSAQIVESATGALQVRFSRSAVEYRISPGQTLLESSEKNGVLIPSGCRQGVCGTCATKLIAGEVHMANEEALNDTLRSQGYILPCVSRPVGNVTLDA